MSRLFWLIPFVAVLASVAELIATILAKLLKCDRSDVLSVMAITLAATALVAKAVL